MSSVTVRPKPRKSDAELNDPHLTEAVSQFFEDRRKRSKDRPKCQAKKEQKRNESGPIERLGRHVLLILCF